jgi:alpha-L-rhamnosidase
VRGPIRSAWQVDGGTFRLHVEVPANAVASIRVPSADARSARDAAGGQPDAVASFPGAPQVQEAVFGVGSGTHEFTGPAAGI